jgi:hypothetical protein
MHAPAPSLPAVAATALVAALVAASCGPSADAGKGASAKADARPVACTATKDDAVAAAAADYIKEAKPKPERFLIAAGTDSALGDPGLTALQNRGPTYLYPGDPTLQATVRAQLHEKGDYTTLLVVRQTATQDGKKAAVRLNGHYVGGESDGQTPGPRAYTLGCDSTTWTVVESRAETAP